MQDERRARAAPDGAGEPTREELERTPESPPAISARPPSMRIETIDVVGAIALAEAAASTRIWDEVARSGVAIEGALAAAAEASARGVRAAVIARATAFASARDSMRRLARARVGLVAHALAGHGSEELASLADLGWAVLAASGPEDSFDLTLIARRAAEDSGVPFIVVHALADETAEAGRAIASVALPIEKACQAFIGPVADSGAPPNAGADHAFAERLPFALGSALRDYGALSGRRHDVFDRVPLGEAPLALVGVGPVGDALAAAVPELRARGYEVSALCVASLRPFPGPRLVKALARSLAVTVFEPAEEPIGQGGLLVRELKAAFTDALTWAPGFPGIGRIPKLYFGVTGPAFDLAQLVAACDNMLADERGRRVFSFADVERALPRSLVELHASASVAVRFLLDDVASATAVLTAATAILGAALGVRAHGLVTAIGQSGGQSGAKTAGARVDLFVSRDRARGAMVRRPVAVSVSGDAAVAAGPTLGTEGVIAWCAGAALAGSVRVSRTGYPAVDGALVARVVTEHFVTSGSPRAAVLGDHAQRSFEATSRTLEMGAPLSVRDRPS